MAIKKVWVIEQKSHKAKNWTPIDVYLKKSQASLWCDRYRKGWGETYDVSVRVRSYYRISDI
jgi:hypothetical protein